MDELREAIEELYYFEFVLDDIPIWGFVGYLEESGFLPHSHKVTFYYSWFVRVMLRCLAGVTGCVCVLRLGFIHKGQVQIALKQNLFLIIITNNNSKLPTSYHLYSLDCLFCFPCLVQVVLWTHLAFNIEYNGDSIIFANVSVKDVRPVPLEEGAGTGVGGVGLGGAGLTVTHTYSVHWFESSLPHSRRAERLRDYSFFPKTLEIHWLSIINSLVLVVLLLGFVIIILMRVLKNDFARSVNKTLFTLLVLLGFRKKKYWRLYPPLLKT